MKVVRGRHHGTPVEPMSETFTETAFGDRLVPPTDGVSVLSVLFPPGARTHWHRHERGQVLHVTSGAGWVGTRDGEAAAVRVGDTVWAPPGEEHWHGAGSETYLVHLALSLGETRWAEEVSREAFDRATRDPATHDRNAEPGT